MNAKAKPYQIVDFPAERRIMARMLELNAGKHCMTALLEVDVTTARQAIEAYKAETGETLSFTGYMIGCLARAVDENKAVQSYRKGAKQLVLFDNVDVGMMIERKIGDISAPTGHVIRDANHKTFREIHQDIRAVQTNQAPSSAEKAPWFNRLILLPAPLSRLFIAVMRAVVRHDPTIATSLIGTVGVTSVGMFGKDRSGWGISNCSHVLDLIVGSMAWKPAVVDGGSAARTMLNLTIIFDHDVIDGAPAARFTHRLVELIESGYGLDDLRPITEFATEYEVVQSV